MLKPGISSLDHISYEAKIKDELDEMEFDLLELNNNSNKKQFDLFKNKKVNFLCTGAYDYKIRLYETREQKDFEFEYLGSLYNGANNIIHKIKFEKCFIGKENNENIFGLYLFVASDQKIINIYNIA